MHSMHCLPIIFRKKINIMKNETVPVCELTGDIVAGVVEHTLVKDGITSLLDDEDAVVDVLPRQDGVEVVHEKM